MKTEQIVHVGTSKVRFERRVNRNWPWFRAGAASHTNKQITREAMKGVSRVILWSL